MMAMRNRQFGDELWSRFFALSCLARDLRNPVRARFFWWKSLNHCQPRQFIDFPGIGDDRNYPTREQRKILRRWGVWKAEDKTILEEEIHFGT